MTVDPSDNNSWHNESSPQAPPPPSPPHPRPLAPHPQPTATLAPMCPHACLQTRQGLLYGLSCVVDGTFIEPKVAPNTRLLPLNRLLQCSRYFQQGRSYIAYARHLPSHVPSTFRRHAARGALFCIKRSGELLWRLCGSVGTSALVYITSPTPSSLSVRCCWIFV